MAVQMSCISRCVSCCISHYFAFESRSVGPLLVQPTRLPLKMLVALRGKNIGNYCAECIDPDIGGDHSVYESQ